MTEWHAEMDGIDRIILDQLQADSTQTYAEIGAAAGLSASAVNDRLKRLRAEGVVRRLSADVDPTALGLALLGFVLVAVNDPPGEGRFREHMKAAPATYADEWESRNRAFHAALESACSSPWLLHMCEILYDQSERYRSD